MSKDEIVVSDWCYKTNWVYVVLSRVRKLSGLFLQKPLDPQKYYKKDIALEEETTRLLEVEKKYSERYDFNIIQLSR